jgi:hypothetical protein
MDEPEEGTPTSLVSLPLDILATLARSTKTLSDSAGAMMLVWRISGVWSKQLEEEAHNLWCVETNHTTEGKQKFGRSIPKSGVFVRCSTYIIDH